MAAGLRNPPGIARRLLTEAVARCAACASEEQGKICDAPSHYARSVPHGAGAALALLGLTGAAAPAGAAGLAGTAPPAGDRLRRQLDLRHGDADPGRHQLAGPGDQHPRSQLHHSHPGRQDRRTVTPIRIATSGPTGRSTSASTPTAWSSCPDHFDL